MKKIILPSNFDSVDEVGDNYFNLSLGGHLIIINSVEYYINEKNGDESLRIIFDIYDDNEFKYCFQKEYDNAKDLANRKWPNEGTKYLSLKPNNMTFLKRFIKAINASNYEQIDATGGKPLNLEQFKDKVLAGNFGLEEYEKDGEIETRISLFQFKSKDQLPYLKISRVKLSNGSYMDFETYKKINQEDENSRLMNLDVLNEEGGLNE